jgi:ribosome-binding protein aMBF1 (putative translation factor)
MKKNMESYEAFKKRALAGRPGLRAIYAQSQPKYDMICQMIDARLAKKMSQSQLAAKIGTKQAVISRFEGGSSNPSFDFLSKMAAAVGKSLRVDFV